MSDLYAKYVYVGISYGVDIMHHLTLYDIGHDTISNIIEYNLIQCGIT